MGCGPRHSLSSCSYPVAQLAEATVLATVYVWVSPLETPTRTTPTRSTDRDAMQRSDALAPNQSVIATLREGKASDHPDHYWVVSSVGRAAAF